MLFRSFNEANGIVPQALNKKVRDILEESFSAGNAGSPERKRGRKVAESAAEFAVVPAGPVEIAREISRLEGQMMEHARNLEFEQAARLRDRIGVLREQFVALS